MQSIRDLRCSALAVRGDGTSSASCGRGAPAKRFIHDLADRAGTGPAFRAAAEALVDLEGRARGAFGARAGFANLGVGQTIAGANDHALFPDLAD